MINGLPTWINLLFIVSSLFTVVLFHYSNGKPKLITTLILIWSIIHSVLAYSGFYENTNAIPPRFTLILIPTSLLIIYTLLPKQQEWFLNERDIRSSTFLHTVRLPVEIVLFGLFTHKMVPELMTFEGRNYDIVMGVTAPIIIMLLFKDRINRTGLIIWNIIGLILIFFILINGILSSELPIQQFGFEQPNRAITYFPFVLLPATIVPIVIWTHLSDLIKLMKEKRSR